MSLSSRMTKTQHYIGQEQCQTEHRVLRASSQLEYVVGVIVYNADKCS